MAFSVLRDMAQKYVGNGPGSKENSNEKEVMSLDDKQKFRVQKTKDKSAGKRRWAGERGGGED